MGERPWQVSMLMATYPLGVALAQEIAPKGKSLVSSMMMGLAFGMGGFLAPGGGQALRHVRH